tara:strand:- start:7 stop:507 length:501 start_codon:yes stop_codon:yes gene_type:complete
MGANRITKAPISDGWHGSQTRVKILPSDWIQNDDYNRATIEINTDVVKAGGDRPGIQVSNAFLEVYACIPIPYGYKATGMKVEGTDSNNEVWAWEACCVGCPAIPLFDTSGTYNVGTEYDFDGSANSPSIGADEMFSADTNYLLIWAETESTADTIYGGYVNIEKV